MSRTDHPRKPHVPGPRVRVHNIRMYGGRTAYQSQCSCGAVGPTRARWQDAHADGRKHLADQTTRIEVPS